MAGHPQTTTAVDEAVIDAMTRGFITAALWTDAQRTRPTDTELVDFALLQGATREYVADADTDRLEADYGEDWRSTVETGGLENCAPAADLHARARELCARFYAQALDSDLTAFMDAFGDPDGGEPGEYVGHTFYLNAAGHGVAFTDRAWRSDDPLTPVCERLAALARTFPEVEHLSLIELADGTVGL